MSIVSFSNEELRNNPGHIDLKKVHSFTDEELERFADEDGWRLEATSKGDIYYPPVYIRRLRNRLGYTQEKFARCFGLSKRTVQEWEQGRAQPKGPARILLHVIDREPDAVKRAMAIFE